MALRVPQRPAGLAALCACSMLVITSSGAAQPAKDVLLRNEEQWEVMERIHRDAVDTRLSEAITYQFDKSVSLGRRAEMNWIDVWGPTFTCPTMEHVGVIGDGGKWVCGVDEFLQRPGCIIYSLGSLNDFTFEEAMLNRTVCDIHVFDPTITPSRMREREQLLNGDGPQRIKWYSIGISDTDTDASPALECYGGTALKGQRRHLNSALVRAGGRRGLLGKDGVPWWQQSLWQPPKELAALTQDPAAVTAVNTPKGTIEDVLAEAAPVTPVTAPLDTRQVAVDEVLERLRLERDRIKSSIGKCGPGAHLPGGLASLPPPVEAGSILADMNATPHGDSPTLCRMATLPSIMKSLGHDWIDVLKMDIEGSEFTALGHLATLPGDAMRFTQLQIEIHHGWSPNGLTMPNVDQFNLLHGLMSHGMRTALLEPNIYFAAQNCHELAMLKMDECGNVVAPALSPQTPETPAQ